MSYFAVIVFVLPLFAFGASYSPEQLIEAAIKNSALFSAYEFELKAKEMFSAQAGVWDNPSFEIGKENKKEPGGDTKFSHYGLSQAFYIPGKFSAKQRVAMGEAEVAKYDLKLFELKLRGSVLSLIFEFKAAVEKLNHAQERLQRFKDVEGFLTSRVFAAPQKRAEASIVAAKLIVLQKELIHIQAQKENLWIELNSYLKLKSEPEINLNWFKSGPRLSLQELSSEAASNSGEILKQSAKLVQSKNEVDLAKVESWPGLTISGNFSEGKGFGPEKNYGIGLSLPIPIFNANSSARSAANYKHQAEIERLNFAKEQINKDLKAAFLNYELAKKSIASLPMTKIEVMEKATKEIDRGFRRGQIDLLTFLEADSQHFESISSILESQLDLVKSISELQIITGRSQLFLEK